MIVDAGLLIALDRGDDRARALLDGALARGLDVHVSAGVEAQVIRNRATQVRLTRALAGMVPSPLDRASARAVGALLGAARATDVIDGHVALLAANHPGPVVTSDPDDLQALGVNPDRIVTL